MAKSIKHQDKLRKLVEPGTDIETIGPVRVCFNQEFCIGTGCGGTAVFLGLHEDGSEVAVKRVIINKNEQLNININEKEILLHVKASKHIVNYRHFEYKQPFFFLIVDLCEETLENYVEAHDEEHLKRHGPVIIREILTGLSALHSQEKKILHLDLKPQNILVDSEGHMRLADFGISRILNEEETTLTTGQMGTRGWMAAESMAKDGRRAKFKRKSDIQVAGMISFYVLMKGKHPFGDDIHYRVPNIIDGNPVNLEQLSDFLARDFVASMIRHNIEDRPYVEEALKHPFLQIKPGYETTSPPQTLRGRLEQARTMTSQSSDVHIPGFFVSDVPVTQKTLEKTVEDHGRVSLASQIDKPCRMTAREVYARLPRISIARTQQPVSNTRNVPAIQKKLKKRKSEDPIGGQGSVSSSSQVNEHNGNPITAREVYEGQRDENARPAGSSIARTQQPVSNTRNVPAIQKKLKKRKSEDPIGGQGSVSSSSQVNEHNGNPITAREVYEGQRDENARPPGISIAQTQQPVSNSGNSINPNCSTSSQSRSNSAGQQSATPGFLDISNGEGILEEVLKEIDSMKKVADWLQDTFK